MKRLLAALTLFAAACATAPEAPAQSEDSTMQIATMN